MTGAAHDQANCPSKTTDDALRKLARVLARVTARELLAREFKSDKELNIDPEARGIKSRPITPVKRTHDD